MTNMVPFTGAAPAFARSATANFLEAVTAGATYPVISLKGKVFTRKEGEQHQIINEPGTDQPARYLECVVLDVGPSPVKRIDAKVFYIKAYEEGSDGKPDCYSNDGIAPAADATTPQANKCALCAHNVWGSGDNGKGTRCASSKRLALAAPDALDAPMLLRVPAGSLGSLNDYFLDLKKRGVRHPAHVVTRISFDYSVAHPALTFKPLGWAQLDPTAAIESEIVGFITGKIEQPTEQGDGGFSEPAPAFAAAAAPAAVAAPAPAPAPAPARPAPAATKPKPAAKPVDDDLPDTPKVATPVRVEGRAETPAPAPAQVVDDATLDDAMYDIDFDA